VTTSFDKYGRLTHVIIGIDPVTVTVPAAGLAIARR
jgi:hypothetical protein